MNMETITHKIMSNRIYLAGPYSDPNPEVRQRRFKAISLLAASMMAEGAHVYSPVTHGHTLAMFGRLPTSFDFWSGHCLSFLTGWAQELHVVKMRGWDTSRGVAAEIAKAKASGVPVVFLDEHGQKEARPELPVRQELPVLPRSLGIQTITFACPWCEKEWPLSDYPEMKMGDSLQCDCCANEITIIFDTGAAGASCKQTATFRKAEASHG